MAKFGKKYANDMKRLSIPGRRGMLQHIESLRDQIIDGRCRNCGDSFANEDLELGHIIPNCQGGLYESGNLRPLCKKCNALEGGKINEKFLSSIYHFAAIFNNRVIKRLRGGQFKSGSQTAIVNGVFFSDITNNWCFSTICGSTIESHKVRFV